MTDEQQWIYQLLEVQVGADFKTQINDLQIDKVSWEAFLYTALTKLHGQFGVAIEREILQFKGTKAVVKVQKEDLVIFNSSIVAFNFNLSTFGHPDRDSYISITALPQIHYDEELDKVSI